MIDEYYMVYPEIGKIIGGGTTFLVYSYLANLCKNDADSLCRVSLETIAEKAICSKKSADRCVKRLAAMGAIEIVSNNGKSSVYKMSTQLWTKCPRYHRQNVHATIDNLSQERSQNVHPVIISNIITNNEGDNSSNELSNNTTREDMFIKPSVEEVAAYCKERKNGIDAQHFCDYYDARGWKMKDWRAVIRTSWEPRERKQQSEQTDAQLVRQRWQDIEREAAQRAQEDAALQAEISQPDAAAQIAASQDAIRQLFKNTPKYKH